VKRKKLKVWTASRVVRVIRRRSFDLFSIASTIITAIRAILDSPAHAGEIISHATAIEACGPGCPSFADAADAAAGRAPAASGARTHSPRELRAVIHIAG
jgi:hypothetical protein